MTSRKLLLVLTGAVLLVLLTTSCGNTRKGCDGRSKTRVDMGWM